MPTRSKAGRQNCCQILRISQLGVCRMPVSRARFCRLIPSLTVAFLIGCSSGQKSGRPDIDAIPEVELRGAADKALLYEFRAKVKKRGVPAAKQDLPDLLAGFEPYEKFK